MLSAFMFIIFVTGLFLTVHSLKIESSLDKANCKDVNLKRSNRAVMMIGITFIVSSISFTVCVNKCECGPGGYSMNFYLISSLILGIILIVLGSIMIDGSKNKNCSPAKGSSKIILFVGLLIFASTTGYLYFENKDKFSSKTAFSYRF
jgi:hypothetical protein